MSPQRAIHQPLTRHKSSTPRTPRDPLAPARDIIRIFMRSPLQCVHIQVDGDTQFLTGSFEKYKATSDLLTTPGAASGYVTAEVRLP